MSCELGLLEPSLSGGGSCSFHVALGEYLELLRDPPFPVQRHLAMTSSQYQCPVRAAWMFSASSFLLGGNFQSSRGFVNPMFIFTKLVIPPWMPTCAAGGGVSSAHPLLLQLPPVPFLCSYSSLA